MLVHSSHYSLLWHINLRYECFLNEIAALWHIGVRAKKYLRARGFAIAVRARALLRAAIDTQTAFDRRE